MSATNDEHFVRLADLLGQVENLLADLQTTPPDVSDLERVLDRAVADLQVKPTNRAPDIFAKPDQRRHDVAGALKHAAAYARPLAEIEARRITNREFLKLIDRVKRLPDSLIIAMNRQAHFITMLDREKQNAVKAMNACEVDELELQQITGAIGAAVQRWREAALKV